MTIIEAIKSGQPFKRKGWEYSAYQDSPDTFNIKDILADDWIVETKSITITEEQYWTAVAESRKEIECDYKSTFMVKSIHKKLFDGK